MFNARALVIALCGIALVAASAMYALACSISGPQIVVQLQSLTIDGVAQTDLMKYQKDSFFITANPSNAHPNSILFLSSSSISAETYDSK